jgi:hypothetical protein
MLLTFPLEPLRKYVESIWHAFSDACSRDIRTKVLLLQGQQFRGIVGVVETDAIKRFR